MNETKLKVQNSSRLFFTADTHFFHEGCRKMCNRPHASVEEMNAHMVKVWNETIGKKDTVIHVGDVSFGRTVDAKGLLESLNGNIVLVRGNHDHSDQLKKFGDRFERIVDILRLTILDDDNQYIIACHFPMLTWDKAHYGAWHVHGHSHGSLKDVGMRRLDVGWDVWRAPLSYHELKFQMGPRTYVPVDHHGE